MDLRMEGTDTTITGSPPPQEPDTKKLKMSAAIDGEQTTKKERYKRRKVAIFFAYLGVGYQGMQKNPGAKTIEGDLEEALYLSNAVPEQDRNNPKRYDWARSARTDKGVSAVGQVVSGRFYVDPPGFIDRLNSNLSPQIRIFGYKRTTASFNAKKFCDRRRYVYLIPVFALDPSAHRDRESVLASAGSENQLVKCFECSERGRKVGGLMGKRNYQLSGGTTTATATASVVVEELGIESMMNAGGDNLNSAVGNGTKVENNNGLGPKSADADLSSEEESVMNDANAGAAQDKGNANAGAAQDKGNGSGFCYGDKERDRFNSILKCYEGTHNFHNFTTRTKAVDPAAQRYIISFQANAAVTVGGMGFVKCEVVGQSFMLHQIRKMIGLAVAIFRNVAPESLLEKALQMDADVNVPTAPEVGLYLDECFFSSYNQKWGGDHEELSMKDYEVEAEDFKMRHIYTHIAATEHKEGVVGLWLHSLNHRNYPDLGAADSNGHTKIEKTADTGIAAE